MCVRVCESVCVCVQLDELKRLGNEVYIDGLWVLLNENLCVSVFVYMCVRNV